MSWVKELQRSVGAIESTLAAQHVTLQEHMRRTQANEEALEKLRAEVKPIALHVAVVGAMGKVVGFLGTGIGIAAGIAKLLGY